MAKARLKAAAVVANVQSKEDCAEKIRKIGDLQGEINRMEADMNEHIRMLKEEYANNAAPLNEEIAALQAGVQSYCEANRDTLTNCGKVKFFDFVTGVVKWRIKPPSVKLTGVSAVIELLKAKGLTRFVRVKEEVNKDAILAAVGQPDDKDGVLVSSLSGIKIVSGEEEFVIEPDMQSLGAA
ncbi:MAG: host-nuclease inhibitor Gam family protein [Neisseriaceae bacterium]|nr:host-nuclease inhibitor Gam family protein [Neisseriaceae bacterium]